MKKFIVFAAIACIIQGLSAQNIDTRGKGERFDHYWSVGVGAGRVNEGLRSSWIEHLKMSKEHCGFNYVRMHGLFCDDMCIYFEKPDGTAAYNWQYVDDVYDRMLAIGVRPFVELSFFPTGIAAKNSKTQMWYRNNISADRENYGKWHDLIKAFANHVVDRYGIDEVSKWYFEVWNEPNLTGLAGFFHGTKSDYFELYRISAKAIKSVDERLRVGGPATSNFIADHRHDGEILDHQKSKFYSQEDINKQQWKGIWIEEFINFCEKENLPLDFISTHPYPTDYALDPETNRSKDAIRYVNSLRDDMTWLKETLAKSKFQNAEIHLTEWSSSPNSRDKMHDLLPPAAYIIKTNLDCIGMANSLMYWTFTDVFEEKGGGETPFHGGFGMVNYQGLAKPSFHAYRMLNLLGDEMLYYSDPLFVSRHSDNGKIAALAFNYPDEFYETVPSARNHNNYMEASNKKVDAQLVNLKPNAQFIIEVLDKDNGNVYDAYADLGSPRSLSIAQTEHLKEKSWSTLKRTVASDENGTISLNFDLKPWTCVLIREI
ncbi:MAG: xylann 1,4-beta-xylosidase [Clostridium sp.]|nr:xylann 1,4-beta-xylosidase [Clostridium sp.]